MFQLESQRGEIIPKLSLIKYIETGQLKFEEGKIIFFGHEMMFIPITTQTTLYHLIKKDFGNKKVKELFFEQGYQHINNILKGFTEKFDLSKMDIKTFLDLFSPTVQTIGMGYMEYETPRIFEGHAFIRVKNNSFAKAYLELYGTQKSGVDDFFRGIFAGFLDSLTKKQTVCTETKCIAKGDKYCEFVTKPVTKAKK